MAFKLILPPCGQTPNCANHPPEPEKPLRIQVTGSHEDIDNLFDDGTKMPRPESNMDKATEFIEPGLRLAQMAFRLLYGRDPDPGNPSDMVPRHQYDIWRGATKDHVVLPKSILEAYAITFDHLIGPDDEDDPETLMLTVMDLYDPSSADYITIDKSPYTSMPEPVLLLAPRCCQVRKGTTDRRRINREIRESKLPIEVVARIMAEEQREYEERKLLKKRKAQASSDAV